MTTTPHILSNGNLSQNWSNTGLISASDDWSGVPSIEGFRGDGLVAATGVNPASVAGTSDVLDVNANQTNPNTFTTGGVAEFDTLTDPTVALQGSGTADAPYLVIHLDATGRQDINLTFDARDIDGSADNSVQPIAVQYRIGAGAWTNVPVGVNPVIADASSGPSIASQVTPVDLTLPSEANGQVQIQVRIITTDAVGSDEWIGIDNIVVSSEPLVAGTTVSIGDATIVEGDAETQVLNFTVTRSDNTGAFTVDYVTQNDSAEAGSDYVGVTGAPNTLTFTAGGALQQQVSITINGDNDIEPNETFTVGLVNLVNATGTATIGDGTATGTIQTDDFAITAISQIQSTGAASPLSGQTVTVEAIVVGDFQNGDADLKRDLNGFYLQEEIADQDANALTSEGLFVFLGSLAGVPDLKVGDRVTVTGTVNEFSGSTQLTATSVALVEAGAVADIDTMAVTVDLPSAEVIQRAGTVANSSTSFFPNLEAYEGMLVRFADTMTITEQFDLDRFVEVRLAAGERPVQFTHENEPSVTGNEAALRAVASRTVVYDDGLNVQNTPIGNLDGFGPAYSTANALRMGDTVENLTGVLDFAFNAFRVRSVEDGANVFEHENARPAEPANVGGTLQVGSFNVLNYFKTLNDGALTANGLEPRGANSATEFGRQTEKLVNVLGELDADLLGLIEIENNFLPAASGNAIEFLVNSLNAELGAGTYDWIDPGTQFVGGDAIAVAFIYKPSVVQVSLGTTIQILDDSDLPGLGLQSLIDNSTVDGVFNGLNTSRAALAVTFEEVATGGEFTAVVNHFKSKSGVGTSADADALDGQGNWQQQREFAAQALTTWIDSDPTGSGDDDFLIIGDLNAYFQEDTIDIIKGAGFENLQETLLDEAYSFVFDGQAGALDYILANTTLAGQVTGVTEWHINADEADALDYNLDFGRDAAIFDADTLVRVSDHDPLLIGLDLTEEHMPTTINGVFVQDQANSTFAGSTTTPVGTNALTITRLDSYVAGDTDPTDDITVGEVFAYDKASKKLFVMNNATGNVEIVDISNPAAMVKTGDINVSALPNFGSMNSLAVANGRLAVAVDHIDGSSNGQVAFYSTTTGALLKTVEVGVLPDMITFTPDGNKLIVANEGERDTQGTEDFADDTDPAGSVSIITIPADIANATAQTVGFGALDGQEDTLRALGVRITPGRDASTDIEPEYISLSADGKTAYVTLQEANSVGVFDVSGAAPVLKTIVPLGYVDHNLAGNESDFSDRDGPGTGGSSQGAVNLHTAPIKGLLMPDSIATFVIGGVTYFATANEGDARSDDSDVARLSTFDLNDGVFGANETALKNEDNAGRLNVSTIDGDTNPGDGLNAGLEEIVTFGGRGISLFKVNGDGTVVKVDDTGGEFQKIIAAQFPTLFNNNQTADASTFDARSDDKGPEPEAVDVANVGGKFYAFAGLERQGGIMVYDVSDPSNAKFTTYVPPDFVNDEDNGPETVQYIDPVDSPNGKGLLLVSNEISGSVTAYQVVPETFTLQLLHLADGEAGLLAPDTAPNLAALVDAFDDDFANTLILAGGDNWLPGPFLAAGTDLSVIPTLNAVSGSTIGATTNVPIGAVDIAIHNAIGVEVSSIGNHEFDLGSRVLRDSFSPNLGAAGWVGANFVHISANLDFSGDADLNPRFTNTLDGGTGTLVPEASTLKGRIAPAVVITEGGEKIGFVGATTQVLESISSPSGTEVKGFPGGPGPNGEFDDMVLLASQLQPVIDELRAEGVNKIILHAHLQQIANEQLLATLLRGVDIILAAGSNTRLGDADDEAVAFPGHAADFAGTYPLQVTDADGKTTLIVNTDNEYTYLGRLVVEFDANGDIVLDSLAANQPINGAYASTAENVAEAWGTTVDNLATSAFADGTKGDKVEKLAGVVQDVIAAKDGNVFGFTDVYLEGERQFVRSQETNLGNLSADANALVAREALGDDAFLVSLKNGGGIRAQIGTLSAPDPVDGSVDKLPPPANPDAGKPEGGVSQLDIENSLRFNNRLMVFDTTPEGLLNILNWGAGLAPGNGGFPQIGGVRFSYDPDLPGNVATTPGSRIRDVALIDENDNIVAMLVDDGVVLLGAPALISVVTLNFTANGGDGYPAKANGSNFRYLLDNGTLSAPIDEALDFTAPVNVPPNALGEQDALADFMAAFHATPATAFNEADISIEQDTRIQNLNFREDTVLVQPPIVGDDGDNAIQGTPFDDDIDGLGGDDEIDGGDGNDKIKGGSGDDEMHGGEGDDTFFAGETPEEEGLLSLASIQSFSSNRHRSDRDYKDHRRPEGDGKDLYDGDAGSDTLDFSALTKAVDIDLKDGITKFGSDTIKEIENLIGTGKDDRMSGNSLANELHGGAGHDKLDGEGGDDKLFGEAGKDDLDGGKGDDLLDGGEHDDKLDGEDGNDELLGQAGRDHLKGGSGNDRLFGGEDNDELDGERGDDDLVGGPGSDKLTGGSGSDKFWFNALSDGIDTITDFKTKGSSQDQIVLVDDMFVGFAGDDGTDLVAGGFLRAQNASGGRTSVQIDVDGGGNNYQTIAVLSDRITTGVLAEHVLVVQDPLV